MANDTADIMRPSTAGEEHVAERNESVEIFMRKLEHPLKDEIETVRAIILGADTEITENIKWNAPSFRYNGDDRVTFHLRPRDSVQLIFHRGAKVKDGADFAFDDDTGMMDWRAPDRAVVALAHMKEIEEKKSALAELVRKWMKVTA